MGVTTPLAPIAPSKPLKILSLDGGGLQAIGTLIILNKLLDTIASNNGSQGQKPRPCDVFDAIVGVGAGGWLALLLGRFRMDITSCLAEWYKITQCITPKSKSEAIRMRLLQHCYIDLDRLVEQIEHLTEVYGTGDRLFEPDPEGARTTHVFVAALKSDGKEYNLFRSYNTTKAKHPNRLLEGPEKPSEFKISSAFGVTGAAKYFAPPWKEKMARSGKTRFRDTKFPRPHNITELALREMWALYGDHVPLSVVVNIGPGLPNKIDVKQVARRFSWRPTPPLLVPRQSFKRARSPAQERKSSRPKKSQFAIDTDHVAPLPVDATPSEQNTGAQETAGSPAARHISIDQKSTASEREIQKEVNKELRSLEDKIEQDIKDELKRRYGDYVASFYYRLAPDIAAPGTTQNDSFASGVALTSTKKYLKQPRVQIMCDEIYHKMPEIHSAP